MNDGYFYLNVALLAVGTLLIRGCFIAFAGRMKLTPELRELFTFIPAAIFPALVMPGSFFHQGVASWVGGKERFLILILSAIVCWFIRNTLFVICFGLIMLYLVTLL